MTAFYKRRDDIKNAINAGEWPAVDESEILAWISYMEDLETELAQAKAAAAQWVTFDGTMETLPGIGATVLFDAGEDGAIVVYYRSHPVQGRSWCHYELGSDDFSVEPGDRWAYLPTPPEAAND